MFQFTVWTFLYPTEHLFLTHYFIWFKLFTVYLFEKIDAFKILYPVYAFLIAYACMYVCVMEYNFQVYVLMYDCQSLFGVFFCDNWLTVNLLLHTHCPGKSLTSTLRVLITLTINLFEWTVCSFDCHCLCVCEKGVLTCPLYQVTCTL